MVSWVYFVKTKILPWEEEAEQHKKDCRNRSDETQDHEGIVSERMEFRYSERQNDCEYRSRDVSK